MEVKINISLLYTNTLLYAKMLKETETQETLSLVVFIFIIGDISNGGRAVWPFLATSMTR